LNYGDKLVYHGRLDDLTAAIGTNAGATTGNYAVFAGSNRSLDVQYEYTEAYSTSFTRSTIPSLSQPRTDIASASFGGKAIFAGGFNRGNNFRYYEAFDVYDESLTRTNPTTLASTVGGAAVTILDNMLLIGGGHYSTELPSVYVSVFDLSLTRINSIKLTNARFRLAAATIGNHALFAGGAYATDTSSIANDVDAFDTSLTKNSAVKNLSETREYLAGTATNSYALFAGGLYNGSNMTDTVETYNNSLTRGTAPSLTSIRSNMTAISFNELALFAGGQTDGFPRVTNEVIQYDGNLTKTSLETPLTSPSGKHRAGATILNDYVIFAGGRESGYTGLTQVDAYKLN